MSEYICVLALVNSAYFSILFVLGVFLAVFAYTFTAQMFWDSTVREVCTGGGHIMSLPGVIFSLSPEGLLFLIFAKFFLGIVAVIVFFGSFVVCAFVAIVIAPVFFVPSLLMYNHKIHKLK